MRRSRLETPSTSSGTSSRTTPIDSLSEHNPANLRYTNTDDRRIEHLAHELSNQDRMRAGNVSSLVRPNIGHLWERIHKFVLIPAQEDWKTERDALKVLHRRAPLRRLRGRWAVLPADG